MQNQFKLHAPFLPTGDQPRAIAGLLKNIRAGKKRQTLLGVTGSGKTFTMANVIQELNRPTLVMSHNKTLAAQLYQEFKEFFPASAVHYFVSYYDYYQPEAYLPVTDTYIEKDAKINDFIDQLRHASTAALLSRRDVIVVASVSAIYGLADPKEYHEMARTFAKGEVVKRRDFLGTLAELQYARNDIEKLHGTFSVKGEVIEIVAPDGEVITRFEFFGDAIERITEKSSALGAGHAKDKKHVIIFPAKHFVTPEHKLAAAITAIETELRERLDALKREGKILEAERLKQRTQFDIAMLRETGYCTGIENYSRHLSGRKEGEPPFTLLDYFPNDFLTFIDESHITIPQIRGMYNGDRARKQALVDYGFRLPSALDNRPLRFEEFTARVKKTTFVSATPSPYELERGPVVEQLIRPTGLLDPTIEVRPTDIQVQNVIGEIQKNTARGERTLVIALTKRNAEDIASYMEERGIRAAWLHSEVKTLERPVILKELREGKYDALVGINLLREGLDLPEVSLICILDADKEGFLRNATTLIQTAGRASRHPTGHVIFYGDTITKSMRVAMDETSRRRVYQEQFNKKRGITPTPIKKEIKASLFDAIAAAKKTSYVDTIKKKAACAQDKRSLLTLKKEIEADMLTAAANLEFEKAAELRDVLRRL